ncbi:MAG: hypothetical protein K2I39_06565 [Muribaculaceae bacterium]|nr:hypothetical protein [Muribaculaceae bacterium]MDE6565030.1 hypothetical protein [Muribaculaceae bacterium]
MATENKQDAPRSVEDRLKTLYELQTILSEIDRIRNIRGELPLEVKDLQDTIAGLNTRIERYQGDIEDLKIKRTAEQNKIENKKLLIERYRQQLDNVRNNHEFDNLTKEIEYETLEIKLSEKNIGEIEREIDNRQAQIASIQQDIVDQTQILAEKKADLENIVNETRTEEENLIGRAKTLEPGVDDRTLNAFKRIRKNARNGLGIVIVDRNACGGCFNRIPPQKQIEIKMHKKVIVCEYCGRIMIDPELAAAVEESKK